jgi:RND family efflux transporter MFP subunit
MWPGLLIGALGAGFVAGAWYDRNEAVSAASSRPRTLLYNVDPMNPAYKSERPGKAPDGMDLVAVYDNDARRTAVEPAAGETGEGVVSLDPEKQQLIGIRVAAAERTGHTERLRLFGRVAADESGLYRINVGIEGFIRDVAAVTTGSRVEKGQLLATFSAPEMRGPIQAYLVAREVLARATKAGEGATSIELATAALQQMTDRLLTFGMAEGQIDEIARTRQVPSTIRITAPANGVVVMRNASVGQKLARGDELFRIAYLARVWVLADVFGGDADHVKPGAAAVVSVPGRTASFRARVSRDVAPQFDGDSQSAKIRVEVDNPSAILRPGMFVDVDVMAGLSSAIEVPADAILDSGLAQTVFVETSAGVFEPREVETGRRAGGRVEIVKGLEPGERVVVAGTFVVDAERRVRGGATGVQALP